jgi:Fungal rhodopsin domain
MGLIYPILRPLKIDLKKKLILFGLFSLGMFSVMCNVAKGIVFLQQPFVHGYIWAITEITVAIIVSCIPMLRPLFYRSAWVGSNIPRSDIYRAHIASSASFPKPRGDILPSPVRPEAKLVARAEFELSEKKSLIVAGRKDLEYGEDY